MYITATDNANGTCTVTVQDVSPFIDSCTPYWYFAPKPGIVTNVPTSTGVVLDTSGGTVLITPGVATPVLIGVVAIDQNFGLTNVANCLVTNGDAVATRVREAIASQIEGLALSGIRSVMRQWNTEDTTLRKPGIICSVDAVTETDSPALSTQDDIGYPVRITIVDDTKFTDHKRMPDYDKWRDAIGRHFRRQRLAGVRESLVTEVEFAPIADPNLPKYDHMVSELIVRAICRHGRGT